MGDEAMEDEPPALVGDEPPEQDALPTTAGDSNSTVESDEQTFSGRITFVVFAGRNLQASGGLYVVLCEGLGGGSAGRHVEVARTPVANTDSGNPEWNAILEASFSNLRSVKLVVRDKKSVRGFCEVFLQGCADARPHSMWLDVQQEKGGASGAPTASLHCSMRFCSTVPLLTVASGPKGDVMRISCGEGIGDDANHTSLMVAADTTAGDVCLKLLKKPQIRNHLGIEDGADMDTMLDTYCITTACASGDEEFVPEGTIMDRDAKMVPASVGMIVSAHVEHFRLRRRSLVEAELACRREYHQEDNDEARATPILPQKDLAQWIRNYELKTPEASLVNPVMSGFLKKQGKTVANSRVKKATLKLSKRWLQRWVKISGKFLYYYEVAEDDFVFKGCIYLRLCKVEDRAQVGKHEHTFSVTPLMCGKPTAQEDLERSYLFATPDASACAMWISRIKAISADSSLDPSLVAETLASPDWNKELRQRIAIASNAELHLSRMHIAASRGELNQLGLYLEALDVDVCTHDGWRCLHSACFTGRPEAVEVICARSPNVDAETAAGETPLYLCAREGRLDCARILLDNNANPFTVDGELSLLVERDTQVGDGFDFRMPTVAEIRAGKLQKPSLGRPTPGIAALEDPRDVNRPKTVQKKLGGIEYIVDLTRPSGVAVRRGTLLALVHRAIFVDDFLFVEEFMLMCPTVSSPAEVIALARTELHLSDHRLSGLLALWARDQPEMFAEVVQWVPAPCALPTPRSSANPLAYLAVGGGGSGGGSSGSGEAAAPAPGEAISKFVLTEELMGAVGSLGKNAKKDEPQSPRSPAKFSSMQDLGMAVLASLTGTGKRQQQTTSKAGPAAKEKKEKEKEKEKDKEKEKVKEKEKDKDKVKVKEEDTEESDNDAAPTETPSEPLPTPSSGTEAPAAAEDVNKLARGLTSLSMRFTASIKDDGPEECWRALSRLEQAQQITLVEARLYRAVRPQELASLSFNNSDFRASTSPLGTLQKYFNRMSAWVSTQILEGETPKARASTIKAFVNMCILLKEVRNYSSLMWVMAGLEATPVHRLKKTWEIVHRSKRVSVVFEALRVAVSSLGNYRWMAAHTKASPAPAVPFLGMYQTQLTFAADGNASMVEERGVKMVNFHKFRLMADIVRDALYFQSTALHEFNENADAMAYIASISPFSKADMDTISKEREP